MTNTAKFGYSLGIASALALVVNYARGQRGTELLQSTMKAGALGGVALAGGWYLYEEVSPRLAQANASPMGRLSPEAVSLLTEVNPDIYDPLKTKAVLIADVPENPYEIRPGE